MQIFDDEKQSHYTPEQSRKIIIYVLICIALFEIECPIIPN